MAHNSLLSPINFAFVLDKTPKVNYLVQQVTIPGMQLGEVATPTPFVRYMNPGNLTYSEFSVTFKVDEDLANYLEIFNWMVELSRPDSFEQYKKTKTDARVLIMNSAKRPTIEASFTDVFPVSIGQIDLDATLNDVPYVTTDVSFAFDRMYFKNIG